MHFWLSSGSRLLSFLFRELLKDMPEYYVPEVIEDLTSKQVLTTELIEGTSLDKIENPDRDTINKVMWASLIYDTFMLLENSLHLCTHILHCQCYFSFIDRNCRTWTKCNHFARVLLKFIPHYA